MVCSANLRWWGNGSEPYYYDSAWLIKTDANGIWQWNKTFGGLSHDKYHAFSVQQTSDGGYILAGQKESYGTGVPYYLGSYGWLSKTDASGNEQWNKTFGNTGHQGGFGSGQQTSDGGYVLAGGNYNGAGEFAWLVKTDANGNQKWNKTFDGLGNGSADSVQQTSDGGYILTVAPVIV